MDMNIIDLFSGGGGLTEGFIRQGFKTIAHVEMDSWACSTLKTRLFYHVLKENRNIDYNQRSSKNLCPSYYFLDSLKEKVKQKETYIVGLLRSSKCRVILNIKNNK